MRNAGQPSKPHHTGRRRNTNYQLGSALTMVLR